PLLILGALLGVLIITKTPPNRIGHRVREGYEYLFGAQPSRSNARPGDDDDLPEVGTLGDLGFEDEPEHVPWWRRGRKGREAAFDSPLIVGGETEQLDRAVDDGATEVLEPSWSLGGVEALEA